MAWSYSKAMEGKTHVRSRLEILAIHSIFMETSPFLKGVLGLLSILFRVPLEHVFVIIEANGFAESCNDVGRMVKQVISVDHADVRLAVIPIGRPMAIGFVAVCLRAIGLVTIRFRGC